ncbi:MAG: UDP-N-acetylmuramoyl-L-alanine--D-glutamate ligase [Thermodesulfobacteriota bacterium]|nr:UDP-N-acetylmuramoyl-L-alanine--D-glutamate ligase [Thermodesulfobacteriota bacterium]
MINVKNKTVVVVGLGTTGQSVACFLKRAGAQVVATDIVSEKNLGPIASSFKETGIILSLGGHKEKIFRDADLVVVSPGVPQDSKAISAARKYNVPIMGDIELSFLCTDLPIIAITGTNGKTTTTMLVYEILKKSGRRPFLGGNIGRPFIEILDDTHAYDCAVLEISSFQLDYTKYFRAHIAVLLNITPDHLDRYSSFSQYVDSKARIFSNQQETDCAILNRNDEIVRKIAQGIVSQKIFFSTKKTRGKDIFRKNDKILSTWQEKITCYDVSHTKLKGLHNLENMMAAIGVAEMLHCPEDSISEGLRNFTPDHHRIEYIGEFGEIKFYDDSKATNVGAVERALENLSPPIILIAGGRGKGSNYTPLRKHIKEKVKALILLGEEAYTIKESLEDLTNTHIVSTMEEAVTMSYIIGNKNDTVLLSPACSSFDMFENYRKRGEAFRHAVLNLTYDI